MMLSAGATARVKRERHPAKGWLVAAAVAALAGCGDEPCGSLLACHSDVVAYTILDTPLDEPVRLNVRACRNGVCDDNAIRSDGPNAALDLGVYIVAVDLDEGTSYADGIVIDVGEQWLLTIDYRWTAVANDGDSIEITVTDEDTGRSTNMREVVKSPNTSGPATTARRPASSSLRPDSKFHSSRLLCRFDLHHAGLSPRGQEPSKRLVDDASSPEVPGRKGV